MTAATEVARHERLTAQGSTRLELDHYLEALIRKPGALPGATALEQARAAGQVHPGPRRLVGGGPQGPRRRRRHPRPDRGAAAAPAHAPRARRRRAGRRAGGRGADRRRGRAWRPARPPRPNATDQPDQSQDSTPAEPAVASLTERRLAQLPADTRPLPSVAAYDQLLRHAHGQDNTPGATTVTTSIPHRRGLTEQAADAAVDRPAGCCGCPPSAPVPRPGRRSRRASR